MKIIGHNLFDKLRIVDDLYGAWSKEKISFTSVEEWSRIWSLIRVPLSSRISNVRRATNLIRITGRP